MRVHEPGHHRTPLEIDEARVGTGEATDIGAGAHFGDTVVRDGHGLGDAEGGIERNYAPAVENQAGLAHE